MFDIIALALQTDSTRVISYMAKKDLGDGTGSYGHLGNPFDYHTLTHHGEDPERLDWLTKVDIWTMQDWAYFLGKLKSIKEGDGTLLDHTLVARSSSGGTANAHNNTLLPAMLCGGSRIGVRHQGHIVESDKSLGNLWATMLTLMGVEDLPSDFMGGECDGIVKPMAWTVGCRRTAPGEKSAGVSHRQQPHAEHSLGAVAEIVRVRRRQIRLRHAARWRHEAKPLYEMFDSEADAALLKTLQQTVWEVVSEHPHTGLADQD